MSYDYFSTDANAGRPQPKLNWLIDGCMVPIYLDGDLIKCVGLCWEYANTQGNEYEIADIRYGSIDGIILPHQDDIYDSIREKMGIHCTLIFPDTMVHDKNL